MTWLLRIGGTLVALALAALIVSQSLSRHFAQQPDPLSATRALTWNPRNPDALIREARAIADIDADKAQRLLEQAVRARPGAAGPLLSLAALHAARDDNTKADALIEQATTLEPADPDVLIGAAAHWVQRGQLLRAVDLWSSALTADARKREKLFPVLLALAENNETRALLRDLAATPPPWWDGFFAEIARRALDIEAVRALYAMRREAAGAPFSPEERRAYLARLQRDGLATEAYLVWVNGLSEDERGHLGLMYNGGFELEPTNSGFDWHLGRPKDALVTTAATFGADGDRALQIVFKDMKTRFQHVSQPLFLDPAAYRFNGRVRADSYQSLGGVQWTAYCVSSKRTALGESERFLGTSEWREFGFEFSVPTDCPTQEIRLQSAQHRPGEKMKGALWFDSLSIRRIGNLPPLAEVTDEPAADPALPAETPDDSSSPLEPQYGTTGESAPSDAPSPGMPANAPVRATKPADGKSPTP